MACSVQVAPVPMHSLETSVLASNSQFKPVHYCVDDEISIAEFPYKQMTKRVRFVDTAPSSTTIDRKTEAEREALWYSPEEISRIQGESKASLLAARSDSLDNTRDCIRGLERMTSRRVFEQKKARRTAVVRQIVKEHHRQRVTGVYEPERIRKFSFLCSKGEREVALAIAAADAAECRAEQRKRKSPDAPSNHKTIAISTPRRKKQRAIIFSCKPSPIKSRAISA